MGSSIYPVTGGEKTILEKGIHLFRRGWLYLLDDGKSDTRNESIKQSKAMKLLVITADEIKAIKKDCEKEGLIFNNTTEYHKVMAGGQWVGITGFMWYANKAVFKNHFIFPKYRGQGFFKEVLDLSIDYARRKNLHLVEAICTPMSIKEYKKRGAVVVKEYANSCTKIHLTI